MATKMVYLLLIFSLLFLSVATSLVALANESTTNVTTSTTLTTDDEDLSFLEEPAKDYPNYADPSYVPEGDEAEYFATFEDYRAWENRDAPPPPKVDEKDVVALNKTTFDEFVKKTKHVMVEFYAPWCGHCQALAPEYAAAATELKDGGSDVVLAKVDAIQENELADEYKVEGFPSIFLFSDGQHKPYNGDRTTNAIVTWAKKKTGPAVQKVTTTDEAERILQAGPKIVVALLDSFTGADSKELEAAAKLEDDVNFYQTTSIEVAEIFQFDPKVKRPSVLLLKKETEKLSTFYGEFSKSAIVEFVSTNKLPLVINFTAESVSVVFENPAIKKQVILFASADEATNLVSSTEEAAKYFKGKIMFIYVDKDNAEYGKPILDYFGIVADAPKMLAYTANEDVRKFLLEGEITLDGIKSFAEDFLAGKLMPYYKSDPIPETNVDDVKIVVGKTFEDIVLDASKDVLLEIYAPWCPHCVALEPTYNRLAKHLKSADSLVVAKMDGTKNEHPRIKVDGFPTMLFFPAGKKNSDPIAVDSEHTAVALYKFLKQHATVPFKIEKVVEGSNPRDDEEVEPSHEPVAKTETQTSNSDLKDEL